MDHRDFIPDRCCGPSIGPGFDRLSCQRPKPTADRKRQVRLLHLGQTTDRVRSYADTGTRTTASSPAASWLCCGGCCQGRRRRYGAGCSHWRHFRRVERSREGSGHRGGHRRRIRRVEEPGAELPVCTGSTTVCRPAVCSVPAEAKCLQPGLCRLSRSKGIYGQIERMERWSIGVLEYWGIRVMASKPGSARDWIKCQSSNIHSNPNSKIEMDT